MSIAGIVAAMLLGGAVSTAFAAASLTSLGILPGGSGSVAKAVSADGSVIVGHSVFNYGLGGIEAFRWTRDGGMVGLGDLPGGSFKSEANGVSADGSVIVGYSDSGSTSVEAFRWTSGGGMVGLGYLPGGSHYSDAVGISGDGSVIVGVSNAPSQEEAFRWTSGGGMVGLGSLLPPSTGLASSGASGVSADGSVIVGTSIGGFAGQEAFRWTSGGGMVALGGLTGGPGSFYISGATGVSGDGSVVVGWNYSRDCYECDNDYYEAFRWTSDGGMVGLGHLFDGETGEPTGISADGSVIVGYSLYNDFEAFRWTSDGGMERLWDVLLAAGVDPAVDGWTQLGIAEDISADGNTIVGYGIRNNNTEAFVAVLNVVPDVPGDFNHDGRVDAADYVVWRKNPGGIYAPDDYNTWRSNFGRTSGSGLAASETPVPEPGNLALLILAVPALRLRRQANPSAATPAPRRSLCAPRSTAVCILTQITHYTNRSAASPA